MYTPFDRKRCVESDEEEDQPSKRPLIDDSTDAETTHTTVTVEMEDNQQLDDSVNNQVGIQQEIALESEGDDIMETVVPYQRLVLINVEVTCDENPTNPAAVQVTKENAEIIQLSFAIVKSSTMELITKQTIYIKPERTPLSQFCTQITGVTSEMLSRAGTLENALNALDSAIQSQIIDCGLNFCFVSHGGWVLRIQVSREAREKKIDLPSYIANPCMFDLKQELQRWQLHHSDVNIRTTNIKELCNVFEIPMIEKGGDSTTTTTMNGGDDINKKINDSNIDILATTVGVMRHLTSFRHEDVFIYPIDTGADLEQFNKEESKVVHLAGLPYEVTQGELEAWFSSGDLRPAAMWLMQMNEQTKPSHSGLVVFSHHDDAVHALLLNGRCLNDRIIEVSPSSDHVVELACSILSPFPLQAKARQGRPGDWNCRNCSFHNFASRQNCFKCNAENPSHTTPLPGAPTGPAAIGDGLSTTPRGTPLSHAIVPSSSSSSSSSSMSMSTAAAATGTPMATAATTASTSTTIPAPTSTTTAPATTTTPVSAVTGTSAASTTNSAQSQSYIPSTAHGTPTHAFSSTSSEWICTGCSFRNFTTRSQCVKCNLYRSNGSGTPSTTTTAGPSPHSYPPRPHHSASFRPGDWYCPNAICGFQNFASRVACYRCNAANPNPPPQPSYGGAVAPGVSFGYDGAGGESGSFYGASSPAPGSAMTLGTGGHGFRAGDWYCPVCNSHNFASRFYCLKCRSAKPSNPSVNPSSSYGGGGGSSSSGFRGGPPIKSGDWVCANPECGFHNFAKRTFCGRCNTPCPDPPYGVSEY